MVKRKNGYVVASCDYCLMMLFSVPETWATPNDTSEQPRFCTTVKETSPCEEAFEAKQCNALDEL